MRIALLPSAFEPSVGGVEELTRHLGLALVRLDHEVEVWTSRRDGDDWAVRDVVDGLPVLRSTFPAPRKGLAPVLAWPRRAASELSMLLRQAREFKPDVLHVQCFSTNGAYALAVSRLTGIPLVVSLQGETVMDDNDVFEHSIFLRTALRDGLGRARAVTGCSDFTLQDARQRFGLPATKGQVVFNGVDLAEGRSEPVDLPFSRFVLAMGRVVEKKGFDLLLRAWAAVAADLPAVGMVIGGDGAALPALRALAQELGIADRVHFPGRLGRGQVAWATQRADVFVMPSRVEPFGIVALEAWRAGTAVLVSSRGGAPEFVEDGVTGLVADPFDPVALGSALQRLLTDDALRARLAEAGRARVADFDWRRIAQEYLEVYGVVTRGGTRASR